VSPFSTAFLARSPAAIRASGLDVLVHEVMAAKTTEPCRTSTCFPSTDIFLEELILFYGTPNPLNPWGLPKHLVKSVFTSFKGILS
jgi:hypothetical protein